MFDFIIDFETMGSGEKAAVIDLAVIAFDPNPEVVETFDELVSRGIKIKFDLKSQKGHRLFTKSTIEWWKNQSPEARKNIAPSDEDVSTIDGIAKFNDYINAHNIDPWKSQGWCRGMSFDFPILVDLIRDVQRLNGVSENELDTFKLEPCKFWNQRDIRTRIEALLLVRDMTTCPLPKGTLDGFVAHDSIHDCAKDILMMKYALRYAMGLEDAPSEEECDPLSLPTKR